MAHPVRWTARRIVLAAALCGVAACGGGDEVTRAPEEPYAPPQFPIEPQAAILDEYYALSTRLDRQPTSVLPEDFAMPSGGSATFTGIVLLENSDSTILSIAGRATLLADFGTRTLTGRADNFTTQINSAFGRGPAEDRTGFLEIGNGRIGPDEGAPDSHEANEIRFDYSGVINWPDSETGSEIPEPLAGTAEGKFYGNPIAGLRAAEGPWGEAASQNPSKLRLSLVAEID